MKSERIDQAIEVCRDHLQVSGAFGTEIEAFLTRYLLLLIYAVFEESIKATISDRSKIYNDPDLYQFTNSCVNKICRSIMISEVSGLLGRFNSSYKEAFQQKLTGNELLVTAYNNIVQNRHMTAHSSGSNMTFLELVDAYQKAKAIIDYATEVIAQETLSIKQQIDRVLQEKDKELTDLKRELEAITKFIIMEKEEILEKPG
ncbi:MAG: HEPN domain-containing protein [Bacillota bacterium]